MSPFLTSALLLVSTLTSTTAQSPSIPPPIQTQAYGNLTGISNVSTPACPSLGACHILVARGSLEPPGYGSIGAIKDRILARVPGSTAEAVDYPAVIKPSYVDSETDGVVAMKGLIGGFIANCDAKIPLVLMGFSQGAQVVSDSLVEQRGVRFPDNSSVDTVHPGSTLVRVAAAVMMGDPSSNLNGSTFHVGNATTHGLYPRTNNANFYATGLAERVKSYCDARDPFCASGKELGVHLGTIARYETQAVEFVVGMVKGFNRRSGNVNGSNGGGNSSTATPEPYTGLGRRRWEVMLL
ncbi:carbohydrate esterase family 5 protein [Zasmidium cellare ATCC 36951]|uniref:Carbohydrate esterase family 5 protein n=1 Tax=Zasmidium cellare ATCC 36951 TaxID=1080233 RepID=A0A6A6BYF7_ZASCE|nr:carbohydrate esterase family 5 protein [Zasmidium cellare ATCC 36951]KAF2159745.1 carbohydrate esterase family 5 protein [Zasmidium cellare ATCC 36951]